MSIKNTDNKISLIFVTDKEHKADKVICWVKEHKAELKVCEVSKEYKAKGSFK